MYQRSDLKNLYDRLKAQYPQYGLDFSGDRLTMTRLHSKVEVDREGVKLYVNGELYDQFTSGDVDDPDDLYELLEAFLLDLQHAGMKQGNETYLAASKQAPDGKPLSDPVGCVPHCCDDWGDRHQRSLAVPVAPSDSRWISRHSEADPKTGLSEILGLSILRPAAAHGKKSAFH
ncbi:hypothetical protein [Eubacterium callanderi]|uniref:hypothetical protein n=1 Tax=Eubacterium callanderi TaxID=53442 RepID=UPI00399113FF